MTRCLVSLYTNDCESLTFNAFSFYTPFLIQSSFFPFSDTRGFFRNKSSLFLFVKLWIFWIFDNDVVLRPSDVVKKSKKPLTILNNETNKEFLSDKKKQTTKLRSYSYQIEYQSFL